MDTVGRAHWVGFLTANKAYFARNERRTLPFFFAGDVQELNPLGEEHPVVVLSCWSVLQGENLETIADVYYQLVLKTQAQGPYLLGGRCVGGLLAYKVAVRLAKASHEVGLLALVETGHPRCQGKLRYRYSRRLLISLLHPVDGMRWVSAKIREQLHGAPKAREGHGPPSRHPSEDYMLPTYPGRLTLICGRRSPSRIFPTAGWRRDVGGGIDVHMVRGNGANDVLNFQVARLLRRLIGEALGQHQTKADLAPAVRSGPGVSVGSGPAAPTMGHS